MESLDGTDWDVLIVGTGLPQSLLATALSRSGKKILHIDRNNYYGGSEAAFSLQEAEDWSRNVAKDGSSSATFTNVSVHRPEASETDSAKLSSSRAYSLSLSPQLIYTRSRILPVLVSSKVHRQIDFLAVGAWWVYTPGNIAEEDSQVRTGNAVGQGTLRKVPNGREDIFAAQDLDMKSKRALMKFLRFIGEYEEQGEVWEGHGQTSFSAFLSGQFRVPAALHAPLLALTLSSSDADHTTTEFALPRIARHLRSIGSLGPGFGSVIPKWGGLSELCQVGCRAGAVGGAVYVLGNGLTGPATDERPSDGATTETVTTPDPLKVVLKDGESVTTRWIVGSSDDLEPLQTSQHEPVEGTPLAEPKLCSRSITIVSSSLEALFPPMAEGAPIPAGAVVFFPSGSLNSRKENDAKPTLPPVYVFVHSSDTGECPPNQRVLYASVAMTGDVAVRLLERAVQALLSSKNLQPQPIVLWSLRYEQTSQITQHKESAASARTASPDERILVFPPTSLDLAWDDSVLDQVKGVWRSIMGDDGGEFMVFEDREGVGADDEGDEL
ncbi:rab geranylgeranyl transferase escort protein-like protein [Lophium mytilinum]|uniref:Rab proteins geranylgeranyltransferase n=1 Tax=Lophium mytilinum TaxID=390894 RepID=A0A6A6R4H6_9PEZI|nr:rab geranylgeranyl transferase escort protein-like protein [Lophium mytilinum]